MVVHFPRVSHATLYFSVTEYLCSHLQKYRLMSNLDQAQGQDHVQPLDLSLQSSASMTLYLMESHKLEEKYFSSKIGKWDKFLTNEAWSGGICQTYSSKSRKLLSNTISALSSMFSETGKCPNEPLRERDGKFWFCA